MTPEYPELQRIDYGAAACMLAAAAAAAAAES
jgi:hypothetical protein